MNAFSYASPRTPERAVELARANGRFLAGGIDLLGQIKEGLAEPATVVNVKALPDTTAIATGREVWVIGANVTLDTLAQHAGVRESFPALAEAAAEVGSPQMRQVATVGGNLAQHSRCWYYRHRDLRCLKRGGSQCYARGGMNKYHSLFTGCRCLSPCVSNLAIALAALDARVVVRRGTKTDRLKVTDVYQAAWSNARVHHTLGDADLILRIEVPVSAAGGSHYLQVSERGAFDWALVSCAVSGKIEGGRMKGVRLVLGAVAPTPWQVKAADDLLEGREPTAANVEKAIDRLLRDAVPQENNGYKIPLARTLVRRALAKLGAAS